MLVVSQSVTIAHNASTSWSRKCCSSGVSEGGGTARSLAQFGRPEKSSASHQTVPASMASRSVCDIGGITLRNTARTRSLTSERRSRVRLSTTATSTNAAERTPLIQTGKSDADHDSASNAANASVQAIPVAFVYASTTSAASTTTNQSSVSINRS